MAPELPQMDATRSILVVLAVQLGITGVGWWMAGALLGLSRVASRHWSAFCALALMASLSLLVASGPHDTWPIAVCNVAVLASFIAVRRGVVIFLNVEPGWLGDTVLLLAMAGAGAADVLLGIDPWLRMVLVSVLVAVVMLRGAVTSWRLVAAEFGLPVAALVSGPMALAGAAFAARLLPSLWQAPTEPDLLMIGNSSSNWLTLAALTTMATLFNVSLAYMVMIRLVRRLRHLARHDTLTGLLNERALLVALGVEQRRVRRGGPGWALLVLDVDHFKRVNDLHGHQAGDEVLSRVGQTLSSSARDVDVVARLGGGQFAVLAPMTDLHGGALLAERLRQAVALGSAAPSAVTVTVSIGVVLNLPAQAPAEKAEAALARASATLLRAKAAGRDRVELAPDHSANAVDDPALAAPVD